MNPVRVIPRSTSSWRRLRALVPPLLVCAQLGACVSHPPVPLDPRQVLAEIVQSRALPDDAITTLDEAERLLIERSPRLTLARAELASAERPAGIETPLPNPEVSAAAVYLPGSRGDRVGTEFGLDWTVWLDDRREQEQALRVAHAERARVALEVVHAEERIALRAAWWEFAGAAAALETAEQQVRLADRSIQYSRQRIESGVATGLELRELELERVRAETERLTRRMALVEARSAVAARLGVRADALAAAEVASDPVELPDVDALTAALPDGPRARLRESEYRVTELDLALEVTRQVPGLGFGLTKEREGGSSRWALGPSIELPLFDRNQLGIAAALGRRDEARVAYETALRLGVGEVEAAVARIELRLAQTDLLRRRAVPIAREVVQLAERAMADGLDSSLRYLDALRVERELALDLIDAQRDLRAAWSALEAAVGTPLPEHVERNDAPPEVTR